MDLLVSVDDQMTSEQLSQIPKFSHENSNTCYKIDTVYSKIVRIFEAIVFLIRWLYVRCTKGSSDSLTCLVGKTAIVTGGNSGIGYATAVLLAARGCRIIIADKADSTKSVDDIIRTTKNPEISAKYLDLASFQSVRNFAANIKTEEKKIDILINNAGIGYSKEKLTKDGLNTVQQINFFGSFLLTHLLLEQLRSSGSARVVFTASVLAILHKLKLDTLNFIDYEETIPNHLMLYSNSKLCNIIAAQVFAEKLKRYGISCYSIDPGSSSTPIFNLKERGAGAGIYSVELAFKALLLFSSDTYTAAQSSIHVASSIQSKLETGGHYFCCVPFIKPRICYEKDFCAEIWKKTEMLVQLRPEEQLNYE